MATGVSALTLVIHTAGDTLIPYSHAERLAALPGPQLWLGPGEEHVTSYAYNPVVYVERVAAFSAANLKPTSSTTLIAPDPLIAIAG